MKFDFDYRKYQEEVQDRINRIFSDYNDDCYNDCDCDCDCNDGEDETYYMIRAILDCPEMEKCHPYLYSLDMENVNESDKAKIKKIYDLGENRGFLKNQNSTDNEIIQNESEFDDGVFGDQLCGGPSNQLTDQQMNPQKYERFPHAPNFTVLYSASRDGNIKVGEYYSNANTAEAAKEECINRMTQCGCRAVNVMAIEQSSFGVDGNVQNIPSDINLYDLNDERQEIDNVSHEQFDDDSMNNFNDMDDQDDNVVVDTSKDPRYQKMDSDENTDSTDTEKQNDVDSDNADDENTEDSTDNDDSSDSKVKGTKAPQKQNTEQPTNDDTESETSDTEDEPTFGDQDEVKDTEEPKEVDKQNSSDQDSKSEEKKSDEPKDTDGSNDSDNEEKDE